MSPGFPCLDDMTERLPGYLSVPVAVAQEGRVASVGVHVIG